MKHTLTGLRQVIRSATIAARSGSEAALQDATRKVEDYAAPIIYQVDSEATTEDANEANVLVVQFYDRTGQ